MKTLLNKKAPDFTLSNTEGERVTLSDFSGMKNVILLFFQ
jgi:peroxiredoxin